MKDIREKKEGKNYFTATNVIAVIIVLVMAINASIGLAILMIWIFLTVGNAFLHLLSRILRLKHHDLLVMSLLLLLGIVLVSVQFHNDIQNLPIPSP